MCKTIFKDAATSVIMMMPNDPMHGDYQRLLAAGTKPNLAKLTIARKIAAAVETPLSGSSSLWSRESKFR